MKKHADLSSENPKQFYKSIQEDIINDIPNKQVWHQPYKAPGIVGSELYDISIVGGPKDMILEKYSLISQKNKHHGYSYEFLFRVDESVQSL